MRILFLIITLLYAPAVMADESRGQYLSRLGDCTSCHTAPGHKPFAGGLAINSPFGVMYSTNITPDKTYGIGNSSLEDFSRALRQGIGKDGRRLYPAMPYPSFAGTSDEDIAALYDYFMHEVEPAHEEPPRTSLPFPFNQRWGLWFWNVAFMRNDRYTPEPGRDTQWNRGAYLVQTLGHCGACHTPRGIAFQEKGSPDSAQFLTGAMLDHWYAPSLRGDKATGLGTWSETDIAAFLKSGHAANVAAFGNMAQVVENSTQYLTDEDRQALAHYLKSLSAHNDKPLPAAQAPTVANERPGAGIYASACASCHGPDGIGKPPRFPKLAGNPAIIAKDATSVMRIVLEGGKSASTQTGPKPANMPAFSRLTDQEIADVVTFIRQSWGNQADAVTGCDVHSLRTSLQQ